MIIAIITLLIIFFVFMSAFFSGMETGLISLDKLKLEQEAKNSTKKKQILDFLKTPDKLFGTTLIGTNISIVIVSSLTMLLLQFIPEKSVFKISDQVGTLIVTFILLIFAEIIPKALYREHPNRLVSKNFETLKFYSFLFSPFTRIVTFLNLRISKLFGLKETENLLRVSREDLSFMVSESETSESTTEINQKDLLEEALEFGELKAENVMTHRTEIVAFDKDTSIDDVIRLSREAGYTRFPVYDDDLDNIKGILIIYDLLRRQNNSEEKASDFIRPILFVPETMTVDALLAEMQSKQRSLAIVVDSYGGTAGMITIEDIMEELVGEIEDEYDVEESELEILPDGSYLIDGDTEIDILNDKYDLQLPEGDYETIAGLIINRLARIPKNNTRLELRKYSLLVNKVTAKKIKKVKLIKKY
ncbi:MAG: hemolysin family protein [Candidatus Stygibacter australis]|nr:hemolysin family protein [Candidatus Stygibacter australis]MDP8321291.1 hemolysin family protein [Candidatus Stygibacter australis]